MIRVYREDYEAPPGKLASDKGGGMKAFFAGIGILVILLVLLPFIFPVVGPLYKYLVKLASDPMPTDLRTPDSLLNIILKASAVGLLIAVFVKIVRKL